MGAYDQPVSVFYVKHPNDRAPDLACCGCIILQEYDIIYNDGIRQEEHLCPPVKSFARKRGFLMKIKGINEYQFWKATASLPVQTLLGQMVLHLSGIYHITPWMWKKEPCSYAKGQISGRSTWMTP